MCIDGAEIDMLNVRRALIYIKKAANRDQDRDGGMFGAQNAEDETSKKRKASHCKQNVKKLFFSRARHKHLFYGRRDTNTSQPG